MLKMNKRIYVLLVLIHLFFAKGFSSNYIKLDENSPFNVSLKNVPDTALASIKFALSLFDSIIHTDIPINLSIEYSSTKRNVFLAGGAPAQILKEFSDLAPTGIFYPISLAEKLSNTELNSSSEPDIICIINQNHDWNYSLDRKESLQSLHCSKSGEFPPNLDFITLFSHEICHGLGLNSQLILNDGYFDIGSTPTIYDQFIFYDKNYRLVNYTHNADSISNFLISENLWFKSPNFNLRYKDSLIKLYSPQIFTTGNSVHHLDEEIYDTSTVNRLMTPIYECEYQRELGYITESILKDIGWNKPIVDHEKPFDLPLSSEPTILSIKEIDQNIDSIILSYSFDSFNNYIDLNGTKSNNSCTFAVPPMPFNHFLSYRFHVYVDSVVSFYPSDNKYIDVYRGNDTIPPVIKLSEPRIIIESDTIIELKGSFYDNSGSLQATIKVNSKLGTDSLLHSTVDNENFNYSYFIADTFNVGDTISIEIITTDLSKQKNKTILTKVLIVEPKPIVTAFYSTSFDNDADFYLTGFQINQNQYLNSTSLQTTHPYEYPNVERDTIFTYAELKTKIIIDSVNHYMEFDEIVLVEPSDQGKRFAEFGFWDYVIIQGSKDGHNWHAFEQVGYDAGYNEQWYELYNDNIITVGESLNSLSTPTHNLYSKHRVNLVQNKYLRKGDTISIRFMLVSDAFSNGWGWSIDNLEIQTISVSEKEKLNSEELIVYPNPTTDNVTLLFKGLTKKNIKYEIYNAIGEIVMDGIADGSSINVKSLSKGYYTVLLPELHMSTLFIK